MTDARTEYRLDTRATVFVELPDAEGDDGAENVTPVRLLCRVLDVSANGLRIRLDRPLLEGAIVTLCAYLAAEHPWMTLAAEVRWVRPDGDFFLAGFSLFDADQTDILAWKRLVASAL